VPKSGASLELLKQSISQELNKDDQGIEEEEQKKRKKLEEFFNKALAEDIEQKDAEMQKFIEECDFNVDDEDLDFENVGDKGPTQDEIINMGLEKNYPVSIDEQKIENYTIKCLPLLQKILRGTEKSRFRDEAEQLSTALSYKSVITLEDIVFSNRSPAKGYYGFKGKEAVVGVLLDEMESEVNDVKKNKKWMDRYLADSILDLILFPEVMVRLIMDEQNVNYEEACRIMQEGDRYGEIRFRDHVSISDDECDL
jgi:hypothetical protein